MNHGVAIRAYYREVFQSRLDDSFRIRERLEVMDLRVPLADRAIRRFEVKATTRNLAFQSAARGVLDRSTNLRHP
jgi:hypothetical protein